MENNKILKVSDPSQKYKIVIFSAFFIGAVIFAFMLLGAVKDLNGGNVLGSVDLPYQNNATGTIVMVGNTATEVLAAKSGRAWFRITNTSTSTVSCVISSSTAGMVAGAGIILEATSSPTYIDSGEAGINWAGAVNCITSLRDKHELSNEDLKKELDKINKKTVKEKVVKKERKKKKRKHG